MPWVSSSRISRKLVYNRSSHKNFAIRRLQMFQSTSKTTQLFNCRKNTVGKGHLVHNFIKLTHALYYKPSQWQAIVTKSKGGCRLILTWEQYTFVLLEVGPSGNVVLHFGAIPKLCAPGLKCALSQGVGRFPACTGFQHIPVFPTNTTVCEPYWISY